MAEEQTLDPQEDRRADLEAAIEAVGFEDSADTVSESSDTPSVSPAVERAVSEQATPDSNDEVQQNEPVRRAKGPTAPIDWAPELKAQWATLAEPVQQAIHRREVHVNQVLQQSADSRRMAESLIRTVEPYRALLNAEGVTDPIQAIDGLFKTAGALSMGSQTQKAQRIAQLVQHYNVDIESLDKALAGSLPQNTEEDRLNRLLEQRMQPYNEVVNQFQQAQQYQQYQVQQQAVQSVSEMAQNANFPHFDDVRLIMADFVDTAAMQGQNLSLEQAYQRACMSVPEIAMQFYQQQSGGFLQNQQQRLDTKRNAASSIVGRATSGPNGAANLEGMSLRDTIAAQMSGGGRI